ncbi:MAG: hypothetical protein DIU54_004715 [Acidobacteriota bacterium]|jgi:tetratricopeptide (TPR) repeat protein|nr:MAG: hypothetical protein DIU54_11205 [Acidobacteriota bacterium]
MRLLSVVITLLVAAGCASAPLRQADRARLAHADARVLDGCYACLLEAISIYDELATASPAAAAALRSRQFETSVLLALRSAELAMPTEEFYERAVAAAGQLSDAGVPLILELARIGVWDSVGSPRAVRRQSTRALGDLVRKHGQALPDAVAASSFSAPFVEYLRAAWTCLPGAEGADAQAAVLVDDTRTAARATPLVRYRLATCPTADGRALGALLTDAPEFVEAGYFRARLPSLNITAEYVASQRTWFDAARHAFPTSAAVTYSLGVLNQTLGDCRTALTHYDATLRLQPHHEDARLQRLVCLGFLGRHETAITAATQLIEGGYDNVDEAFYWRAWNRNQLRQLDEARADIDQALTRRVNARNYSLAGTIKYHQRDLEAAERDLRSALEMDGTMCLAHWYLGLVAFEREDWPGTGAAFEGAADCYRDSAAEAAQQLAAIEAADLDPDFKKNQILGFRAVIQEDRAQEQASCLNAASGYVRIDDRARAAALLARIPDSSDYASGAQQLREYIAALAEADEEAAP